MLKLRAKLYRFDTKSDVTPEWKVGVISFIIYR